jgi:hypothetical protein
MVREDFRVIGLALYSADDMLVKARRSVSVWRPVRLNAPCILTRPCHLTGMPPITALLASRSVGRDFRCARDRRR